LTLGGLARPALWLTAVDSDAVDSLRSRTNSAADDLGAASLGPE
jgi:hypothetical protein